MGFSLKKILKGDDASVKDLVLSIKNFLLRQLNTYKLAIKGFTEDKVQMRASALTYYSLLSLVPLFAMVFGIAKGFGFESWIEDQLHENLKGQEDVVKWLFTFVERYLSNIKGGVLAGIGLIVLFASVLKLLGNIENSFNDIWQIKKSRGISKKVSDYISLIVIAPILVFVSSSVNIFLADQIKSSSQLFPLIGYIGPLLSFFVSLIPFVFMWLVFTLLYIIMPNTKVQVKSAMVAGIIAGILFQALQLAYVQFQSYLSGISAIYGSFAALPLFLIWLRFSWLFVLFGAEIAFAYQNIDHYEAELNSNNLSAHMRKVVSLMILKEIANKFKTGHPPETADYLANKLNLSIRLVRDILYDFVEIGILSEAVTPVVKQNAFQPAKDISRLDIATIIKMLDKKGTSELKNTHQEDINEMKSLLDSIMDETNKSAKNKNIYQME